MANVMTSHVREVLDELKSDLENGIFPLNALYDQDISSLELTKIFGRSWVFIGHETEIPAPGDYAIRYIGEDSFIFVRDEEGRIRVLFGACRHRGTQICRVERGNASHFRCPYHGWTYKNNGDLVGIPNSGRYRDFDMSDWGLLQAPHVDSYNGLVFASLDPKAPSLGEFLGDIRWYLDIIFKMTEGKMEVIGEPHRWVVDADWKIVSDQFNGDAAHLPVVHRSAIEMGLSISSDTRAYGASSNQFIYDCGGHTMLLRLFDKDVPFFGGYPKKMIRSQWKKEISKEQYAIAKRSILFIGHVFPNFSVLFWSGTDDPKKPGSPFFTIRQWQPKGRGRMEGWSWILAPEGASKEYKERTYRISANQFSPGGTFESDDLSMWKGITSSSKSIFAHKIKLNYQMGYDQNGEIGLTPNWPGPGKVYSKFGEHTNLSFWRRWHDELIRE